MAKAVQVGVIGMGIGRANGRAIDADPHGSVTALCDIDEAKVADSPRRSRTT